MACIPNSYIFILECSFLSEGKERWQCHERLCFGAGYKPLFQIHGVLA